MSQPTTYKRSFAGSVGSGMKSIMGGDNRRFYVLEHKISTKYHKAGESQKIIVDEIELGRDPKCQIRFDENFGTVSRRHAAIVKDGSNWKLVQLSKTNSTYLNGKRVEKEWYLQSGDEIQLSTNGPKLGFIVPQGDKGLVKSIGMTARLNLFGQQALRPYKQAIAVLSCCLLLAACGGGYIMHSQYQEIKLQKKAVLEAQNRWQREKAQQDSVIGNLSAANAGLMADAETRNRELERLKNSVNAINTQRRDPTVSGGGIDNEAINTCLPHIYYIQTVKFELTMPSGEQVVKGCDEEGIPGWSGTGFLLNDGRFVTARHVSEAWYFWRSPAGADDKLANFNYIVNNGGKVVAHFMAISSSGDKLAFTSNQFTCDRSNDATGNTDDGKVLSLARLDHTDFAYFRLNKSGGLAFDSGKSTALERGTKLTVLGFPLGLGANSIDDISPIYGSGITAAQGLQQGIIITTDTNYEQGNSGGPVFYTDASGRLVVVGIVSAGAGRNTGFVVPISAIR